MTLTALFDRPRGQRKVNIGCGFDKLPDYINVDLNEFHAPDVIANVLDLSVFPTGWADEVLAKDVIEHLRRTQTVEALLEWNRVLTDGGRLFLSTTYLTGLMRRTGYDWFGSLETHKELILNLFSSQAYDGDFHCTAFTEKLMRFYLWETGFEIESLTVKDNWLFNVWAVKRTDYGLSDLIASSCDDRTFVEELYRRILLREGEEAGVQSKIDLLEKGSASRREIMKGVLLSEEREEVMTSRAPEFVLEFDQA